MSDVDAVAWYVKYTVLGQVMQLGPYTHWEALCERNDVECYEAVTDCYLQFQEGSDA